MFWNTDLYLYVCTYVHFCILPRMLVSVFRRVRNKNCYYFSRWSVSLKAEYLLLVQHTIKEYQSKWDEILHNTAKVLVVVFVFSKYIVPKSGTATMQEKAKWYRRWKK